MGSHQLALLSLLLQVRQVLQGLDASGDEVGNHVCNDEDPLLWVLRQGLWSGPSLWVLSDSQGLVSDDVITL